jgi:hypothetical protein
MAHSLPKNIIIVDLKSIAKGRLSQINENYTSNEMSRASLDLPERDFLAWNRFRLARYWPRTTDDSLPERELREAACNHAFAK